jgi:hypothetical protein
MKRNLPTIEDITRVIPANCTVCGAGGNIYPYPEGEGTMYCPNCSPPWLEKFVTFGTEQLKLEYAQRLHK